MWSSSAVVAICKPRGRRLENNYLRWNWYHKMMRVWEGWDMRAIINQDSINIWSRELPCWQLLPSSNNIPSFLQQFVELNAWLGLHQLIILWEELIVIKFLCRWKQRIKKVEILGCENIEIFPKLFGFEPEIMSIDIWVGLEIQQVFIWWSNVAPGRNMLFAFGSLEPPVPTIYWLCHLNRLVRALTSIK